MTTSPDNASQIVPMGKYKGKPVETVLADDDYCRWLTGQGWFRDNPRYTNLYQTIINYGGQPQDSPEHNALQAQFLDDTFCLKLAQVVANIDFDPEKHRLKLLKTARKLSFGNDIIRHVRPRTHPPEIQAIEFEADGWDVVFTVSGPYASFRVTSIPPCSCGECVHSECRDCTVHCYHSKHTHESRTLRPDITDYGKGYLHVVDNQHCDPACFWSSTERVWWFVNTQATDWSWKSIHVECKPMLGDDYPSALRQINRYKCEPNSVRCVVARELAPTSVTVKQVKAIYEASGIQLVLVDQINREVLHEVYEDGLL